MQRRVDSPPVFVPPNDDLEFMEPLLRLKDAIEQVDKDHPDVRLLSAHVAVVVSAVLSDSENVADENDALTAQNRKLSARVERLERTVGRQKRKLDEALASVAELRTIGNAERRLRRCAEQTRDDAVRASDNQHQPTAVDELVQLRRQLKQADTDIDRLATSAENAERDNALHRRAQLAILLETLGADEPDEVEQPAAPDTFGEVLACGRHPLVEYSRTSRSPTASTGMPRRPRGAAASRTPSRP